MDSVISQDTSAVDRSLILLVKPSAGTAGYTRADRFRTCLSLAALAAGLRDQSFLRAFRDRLGPDPSTGPIGGTTPFTVRLLDLSLPDADRSVGQRYCSFIEQMGASPLLVGVTANSGQIDQALAVAEAAREFTPRAVRMVGGPHASVAPETFLGDSFFDLACLGDGVETMAEAALKLRAFGRLDLERLEGVAYRDETGRVVCRPNRSFLMSPDEYPFPSTCLNLFVDDLADKHANGKEIVYVPAGTGCPFNCTFCAQRAIHRGRIRERSGPNLLAEIERLILRGFRRFALVQESFFSNRQRVEEFCDCIERKDLHFEWTVEARADQVSESLLRRVKKNGLRFIQIGLESGDQDTLDSVDKKIRLPQVVNLISLCRELRIDTALYMLVGLPGQGWQSVLRSAAFIRDNVPYNTATMHLSVAVAIPYPGTALSRNGAIRMLPALGPGRDWPTRNPEVTVDDHGEFAGRNFTETDDMESGEILEALVFLDYFGQFLLHAVFDPSLDTEQRFTARRNALIMFSMIERRAVRDAVIRAHDPLTPDTRRRSCRELTEYHAGTEERIRDVALSLAPSPPLFTKFLALVRFANGFQVMKRLSAAHRLTWMQACAVAWQALGRPGPCIRFEAEDEKAGDRLDSLLGKVDVTRLYEALQSGENALLRGSSPDVPATREQEAVVCGVSFRQEDGGVVAVVPRF